MNQRDLKLKMKDGSLNLELDYEDCLYKRRYRDISKDKSNKFCVCGGHNNRNIKKNLGHNSTIKGKFCTNLVFFKIVISY